MLSKHIDMADKLDDLENLKKLRDPQTSTFFSHTHNDIGGRYSAISSPNVVGEKLIPQYPAAFLNHDPCGTEPPLNVDVNALETCGEPHEIRASKEALGLSPLDVQGTDPIAAPSQPSRGSLLSKRVGSPPLSSRTFRRL